MEQPPFHVWLLVLLLHGATGLRCLDNDGQEVEWWFMYKTPGGYNFSYTDPSIAATSPMSVFPRAMNDDNPIAITRTLIALAENPPSPDLAIPVTLNRTTDTTVSYYLYNDEPASGTASSSYGHTKGVVAADEDGSGLWISHSTPRWPASTGKAKFYFPEEEIIYGQTFLCMSLNEGQLDAVGKQQLLTRPAVYHRTRLFAAANSTIAASYPNIAKVLVGNWDTTPGTRVQDLHVGHWFSRTTFTSLVKNKEWNGDMWEGLVASHYSKGLLVESWMRGQRLGPYCPPHKPYTVNDIEAMHMTGPSGKPVNWHFTQDHAKWAVGLQGDGLICIGDINRMMSQRNRGGGAICFRNRALSQGMFASINSTASC